MQMQKYHFPIFFQKDKMQAYFANENKCIIVSNHEMGSDAHKFTGRTANWLPVFTAQGEPSTQALFAAAYRRADNQMMDYFTPSLLAAIEDPNADNDLYEKDYVFSVSDEISNKGIKVYDKVKIKTAI